MRNRLGEILVDHGLISEAQLQCSLHVQKECGKRLGEILVDLGFISSAQIHRALNHQRQLVAGLAVATGLGLGLVALTPQPARAGEAGAHQTATQQVVISVPRVMQVHYTGNPVLAFPIEDQDILNGYKILADQGDLQYATNIRNWVVRVQHSTWNAPLPLKLFIKYGSGDEPSDKGWIEVGENFTDWLTGNSKGDGVFPGVDWMTLLPIEGMSPGLYQTTVTFTLEDAS